MHLHNSIMLIDIFLIMMIMMMIIIMHWTLVITLTVGAKLNERSNDVLY